jgi:hypothetical protein
MIVSTRARQNNKDPKSLTGALRLLFADNRAAFQDRLSATLRPQATR